MSMTNDKSAYIESKRCANIAHCSLPADTVMYTTAYRYGMTDVHMQHAIHNMYNLHSLQLQND